MFSQNTFLEMTRNIYKSFSCYINAFQGNQINHSKGIVLNVSLIVYVSIVFAFEYKQTINFKFKLIL